MYIDISYKSCILQWSWCAPKMRSNIICITNLLGHVIHFAAVHWIIASWEPMHDWDKHVWCTVHFLSIIFFIIQYAKFKWENSNQIKKKSANTHLLQSINKPKRMQIQLKFHWWT